MGGRARTFSLSRTPGHVDPAGVPGWLREGRGRGPALRRWQWASPSPPVRGARAGAGAWGRGWASAHSQGPAQSRLEAVPAPPPASPPCPLSPNSARDQCPAAGRGREPAGGEGGRGLLSSRGGRLGARRVPGAQAKQETRFRTVWESQEKVVQSKSQKPNQKERKKSKSLQIDEEAQEAVGKLKTHGDGQKRSHRNGGLFQIKNCCGESASVHRWIERGALKSVA